MGPNLDITERALSIENKIVACLMSCQGDCLTINEIADSVGCSRQYVGRLMPKVMEQCLDIRICDPSGQNMKDFKGRWPRIYTYAPDGYCGNDLEISPEETLDELLNETHDETHDENHVVSAKLSARSSKGRVADYDIMAIPSLERRLSLVGEYVRQHSVVRTRDIVAYFGLNPRTARRWKRRMGW